MPKEHLPKLTRSGMVRILAQKTDKTQHDCEFMLDTLIRIMQDGLAEGREVELRGFGCFAPAEIQARMVHNPTNLAAGRFLKPGYTKIRFRAGTDLKNAIQEADLCKAQ